MPTSNKHLDLIAARTLCLGAVAAIFPVASIAVFHFETSRTGTADVVAAVYSLGLFAAFTTAFWPLPSLRSWTRQRRIESAALLFMVVSYATHLSWELGWLVLHQAIAAAPDAAWAYPWWAYIDGGDMRYATAPPDLVMMEVLSVTNGLIGVVGLRWWYRCARTDRRPVMLLMATAVVHLYSVALYYGSEIVAGLPSVGDSAFDVWVKFGLANAPWAIMPWVVIRWGLHEIHRLGTDPPSPEPLQN